MIPLKMARVEIFVFGSNLAGRHGAGAALYALRHCGAVYGRGVGLQGDSYAIPTKDADLRPLLLSDIRRNVRVFIQFAREHPEFSFQVTAIGCGLAGYKPAQIAPFFELTPPNVVLPAEFVKALQR